MNTTKNTKNEYINVEKKQIQSQKYKTFTIKLYLYLFKETINLFIFTDR